MCDDRVILRMRVRHTYTHAHKTPSIHNSLFLAERQLQTIFRMTWSLLVRLQLFSMVLVDWLTLTSGESSYILPGDQILERNNTFL